MTPEEMNKACEWMDKRLEFYATDTGKFDYKAFLRDFSKAMTETVTNCNGLTWEDIRKIIDIYQHTAKLTKDGELRKQEDVLREVLSKFKEESK